MSVMIYAKTKQNRVGAHVLNEEQRVEAHVLNGEQTEGAVLYTAQTLTAEEQAQARENINAPGFSDIPQKTSDLENDSGFITSEDIPIVPTKTSELQNDSGFITAEDIPPMVTDLGVIDPEPYDDDIYAFLNTLTESGWYKFVFGGDDLTYFVAVQAFYMEDSDTTLVNQHYWGDEEGPIAEYIRAFILEGDEVVGEWSTSYMTLETAVNTFAQKTHVHYEVDAGFSTVWVYANSMTYTNGRPVIYTDRSTPAQWYIESFVGTQSPNYAFQRLTDMHDPSVIYQRSGVRSGGRVTWGDWYKFTGEVYTPGR